MKKFILSTLYYCADGLLFTIAFILIIAGLNGEIQSTTDMYSFFSVFLGFTIVSTVINNYFE